jgi:hypothetical protein
VVLELRRRVVVHVAVGTIVHRLRRWVSISMSLSVWVSSGELMRLMLIWWRWVVILLIRSVRLSKWRRRLTWMTVEPFSRWRELIEMWLYHSIWSIHLGSWVLLWWLRYM